MRWGQEEIIEYQRGDNNPEQTLPEAAKPGAEYNGAEKHRCEGLGMPEIQGVAKTLLAFAEERAGKAAVQAVVGRISGLSQFV